MSADQSNDTPFTLIKLRPLEDPVSEPISRAKVREPNNKASSDERTARD